jgi:hypothetical protein
MKEGKMDELEEVRLRDATMSHHEIMVRFRKLFGREMTPKERQAFLFATRLIRNSRRKQLAHQGLNLEIPSRQEQEKEQEKVSLAQGRL